LQKLFCALLCERRRCWNGTRANRDVPNFDTVLSNLLVIDWGCGNLIHDLDPFHNAPECRELTGELGLIRNNDHELGTCTIRLAR
jgi:hypothetical protein